jgi:chromate reductase
MGCSANRQARALTVPSGFQRRRLTHTILNQAQRLFSKDLNTIEQDQVRRSYFSIRLMKRSENTMRIFNLAVIVGSLRRESFNRQLSNGLPRLAPAERSFVHLNGAGLTLDGQDQGVNSAEAVTGLKAALVAAQGLSFAASEYKWSVPGVLKTAIDQASRPVGQIAWTETGAGILGAAMAQQHLSHILAGLDLKAPGQSEAFGHARQGLIEDADPVGAASKLLLQAWLDRYVAWIKRRVG